MARGGRLALAAALTLALAGCSYFRDRTPVPQGPVYSPNGEPLSGGPLGEPSCEDAMRRWLAQVDTDHDGTISLGEFLADARRQFAAMDLEKTGVLTPSVLGHYRAPYATQRPGEGRRDGGDGDDGDSRKLPPPAQDHADPVMLADVALRNRVTLDEFLAYERRNFASLDRDHVGRLNGDDLLATCQPSR